MRKYTLGVPSELSDQPAHLCSQISLDWPMRNNDQGPDVQSMVSLTSLLITNSLTVLAKVFSNTLIFLLQKCE